MKIGGVTAGQLARLVNFVDAIETNTYRLEDLKDIQTGEPVNREVYQWLGEPEGGEDNPVPLVKILSTPKYGTEVGTRFKVEIQIETEFALWHGCKCVGWFPTPQSIVNAIWQALDIFPVGSENVQPID